MTDAGCRMSDETSPFDIQTSTFKFKSRGRNIENNNNEHRTMNFEHRRQLDNLRTRQHKNVEY